MASKEREHKSFDVLIVGAGLSGLTAAYTIVNKDKSLTVAVIEAKDRIGGRTVGQELKGANGTDRWDVGGQWVGSSQPHIMKLLEELGLDIYKQYIDGKKVMQIDNIVSTYQGEIPALKIHSLIDLHIFMKKIERLRKRIPITDPSQFKEAEKWDSITFQQILDQWLWTKSAKDTVATAGRCIFGAEPCDMSMLYYLMYVQAAGGIDPLIDSGQEYKIKGGAFQIAEKLVERLGEDNIYLNEVVNHIIQQDKDVLVQTAEGKCYKCDRLIVAIPPHQAAKIHYSPCLPIEKLYVFQRMPVGYITKIIVTYKKAFWRENGYSGAFVTNGGPSTFGTCKTGPLNIGYDATTDNGSPALVAFIGGSQQIEYSDLQPQVRRQAVLHSLAEFFGSQAWDYIDYYERNWNNEPYSEGGPVSVATPGVISHIAPGLRYPFKRIHFAGTESATVWCGFMNGAVQAGQRAAYEVLYNLRPSSIEGKDIADTFYNMTHRRPRNPSQCLQPPSRHFSMYRLIIPAAAIAISAVVIRKMLLTLAWH